MSAALHAAVRAAQIANDERTNDSPTADVDRLLDGLRLSVRKCQLGLLANPDPASPWWFLVDPHAEFTP